MEACLEGASLHFLFLYQLVEGVLLSTVKLPLVVQRLRGGGEEVRMSERFFTKFSPC